MSVPSSCPFLYQYPKQYVVIWNYKFEHVFNSTLVGPVYITITCGCYGTALYILTPSAHLSVNVYAYCGFLATYKVYKEELLCFVWADQRVQPFYNYHNV